MKTFIIFDFYTYNSKIKKIILKVQLLNVINVQNLNNYETKSRELGFVKKDK